MCKDFVPQYKCGHEGKPSTKICRYQEALKQDARLPTMGPKTIKQNNMECDALYSVEYENLRSTNCPDCHRINGNELRTQDELREEREREWAMERLEAAREKERERLEREARRIGRGLDVRDLAMANRRR